MAMGNSREPPKRLRALRNIDDVFEALGGVRGVMKLTGARQTTVLNWLNLYKRFPSRTYLRVQSDLKREGYIANPDMFNML